MSFWRGLLRILGIIIGLVGGPVGKLIGLGLTLLSQGGGQRGGGAGLQSSPRYGFDTLSNAVSPGGPIPVVYGQELVAPPIISTNIIQNGKEQILKILCLLSEGEIESVASVRLNDTDIASFTGASYETRLGTSDQASFTSFNQTGTPYDANITLQTNDSYIHEMRGVGDELVVNLTYQGGLYYYDKKGKVQQAHSTMRFLYKLYGLPDSAYAPWIDTIEGWSKYGQGSHRHSAASQAVYRYQARFKLPTRGRYVFKIVNEAWSANGYVETPTVANVIEINSDQRAYANCALLAITCPASAQISGAMPRITCVVKGRKVYDPRTATTSWSRNPILVLRDMLLHERFGLGRWISSSEIDDGVGSSFRTVADACDATVTTPLGTTEAAHQFDMVLDTRAPARDWIDQILRSCRATLYSSHGKLRLARYASGSSVRTFSEDEGDGIRKGIVATQDSDGSERSTLVERWLDEAERWNAARFLFVDRDEQYKRRTVLLRDQRIPIDTGAWIVGTGFAIGTRIKGTNSTGGTTNAVVTRTAAVGDGYVYYAHDELQDPFAGSLTGASNPLSAANPPQTQVYPDGVPEYITPERLLETQLFGVTRRTQAQREARHHLLLALYCPRFVTFDVFLGDLDLEPGDHIAITSTRLGYAAKQFTVLSITARPDGFGSVEAREYDVRVFTDGIDPIPNAQAFMPGGTIPPGLRNDILASETTGAAKAGASTATTAGLQVASSASPPTSEATDIKVTVKEKV